MTLTKADFGTHLAVYPVPQRLDYLGRPLPLRSDDWMVSEVTDDNFEIKNTATAFSAYCQNLACGPFIAILTSAAA